MKSIPLILMFLLPATILSNIAFQQEQPDVLRDLICAEETRGYVQPQWRISKYSTAWGSCQVKYPSAIAYSNFDPQMRTSGVPSRSPGDLFITTINRGVAGEILDECRGRKPNSTGRELAYCYCAGPNSRPYKNDECRRYAKKVGEDYAIWDLQQQHTALNRRLKEARLYELWQRAQDGQRWQYTNGWNVQELLRFDRRLDRIQQQAERLQVEF